jgi:hypothetical protein
LAHTCKNSGTATTLVAVAWIEEKVSNSYSYAAILERSDQMKPTVKIPPQIKSAIDTARTREARLSSGFVLIIGFLEYI